MAGTVPVNKELLAGTVPVNKELLAGRVPVNNLFLFFMEEVIFRNIPENRTLLSGIFRKITAYFPEYFQKIVAYFPEYSEK